MCARVSIGCEDQTKDLTYSFVDVFLLFIRHLMYESDMNEGARIIKHDLENGALCLLASSFGDYESFRASEARGEAVRFQSH